MLNISAGEARKNLKVQLLIMTYSITDEVLIDFLKNSMTEEEDIYLNDLDTYLDYIFDFDFEWVGVPEEIATDHAEGYNYYILGAILIPELLPYASHPLFIDFTRKLQIVEHGYTTGNLIEMVYLPDSLIAMDEDPLSKRFGNQPATFMLGMQDSGGMDLKATVEYLLELRRFNKYVMELIKGPNERGETAA